MDPVTTISEIAEQLKKTVGLIVAAIVTTQIVTLILLAGLGRRGTGRFMVFVSAALVFLGFCWGVVHYTQP